MIKIEDRYQVIIEKQDHFGSGITKIDEFLIFVAGCLKGDEVLIKITEVKKKYAKAKIEKIINPSEERRKVKCSYYSDCGGCQIMHQKYLKQLEFKEMKIKELFAKFFKLENIKFNSILYGDNFNYRNKVIFHGNGKLGFYKEKTHQIISIDDCLLIDASLNKIYNKILIYQKENPTEKINEMMLRKTSLNEILISIEGNINSKKLLNGIDYDIKSLYVNDSLIYGEDTIIESISGMRFKILPKAFFQINYEMMIKLYQIIIDYYKNNDYNQVLDLYCGTGTIGMLVSPYVNKVIGVEVVKEAIKSAKMNSKLNNITNIEFLLGKVEDHIKSFKNIDSIIVDPPRSGLDKLTLETILRLNVKSIVYVSCDPVTLVRDLKILSEKYQILEVTPIDMFPNTYHVESVSILVLK